MNESTFICSTCGSTNYEQFSQTQVRCQNCGTVSDFKIEEKITSEIKTENTENKTENKIIYTTAPLSKRIVNYLIDVIIVSLIVFTLGTSLQIEISTAKGEITEMGFLIMMLTIVIYYFLLESIFGKTIGKFITRTKVISNDGGKASFLQCFIRAAARLLPFEQISGLFFKGIFWHDAIPKTMVVED